MSTTTPNLNLIKPAGTDFVNVSDLNGNFDIIDTAFGNLQDSVSRKSDEHPNRLANIKYNCLLCSHYDLNSQDNNPGCVRTNARESLTNCPPIGGTGDFYALWDYESMYQDGTHAHALITIREMTPVYGRIWQNWYNWTSWSGWKQISPQ